MQGLCDAVMRELLTEIGGFDGCVSEFVRVTHTVHSRPVWLRHMPELAKGCRTAAGTPCVLQLLGSDEEKMAQNAAVAARFGASAVDLNFGCPAPTVNRHQGGAVLLREPERIRRITAAVREALPPQIPLTAKMRLGYEDKHLAADCARALEAGGAAVLTVHARTKVQGYRPPADWAELANVRKSVSVPVVANGDVFTLDDYVRIREISGCDDVMLGRGAVMRPALGRQIAAYLCGQAAVEADFDEEMLWIRRFFDLCRRQTARENYPVFRLKQWLGMMKPVRPEAGRLFDRLRPLTEQDAVAEVLQTWA